MIKKGVSISWGLEDVMEELLGADNKDLKYKLVRSGDELTHKSKEVKWIDFDDNGRFNKEFKDIKQGRSLLMSPFTECFTWMTTEVVEIISNEDSGCIFKIKNSTYTLTKI